MAERAYSDLLVIDRDELLRRIRSLVKNTLVGLRDRGRIIEVQFVGVKDDRVLVRDTTLTHRLYNRGRTPRQVFDMSPYDIRAVEVTKFKHGVKR